MDNYKEWRRIFRMFKKDYPEFDVRGLNFEPYQYQEIRVYVPGKGKLIYNPVGVKSGKIRWEERWNDEKRVEQENRDSRPGMYQRFLSEINILQKETGMTQGDISEVTGGSRKSINR